MCAVLMFCVYVLCVAGHTRGPRGTRATVGCVGVMMDRDGLPSDHHRPCRCAQVARLFPWASSGAHPQAMPHCSFLECVSGAVGGTTDQHPASLPLCICSCSPCLTSWWWHTPTFAHSKFQLCAQLFSLFDQLVVAHGVHKVETAGE